MSALDVARSDLVAAALKVTQETWMDTTVVHALCVAATTYTDARRAAAPKGGPKPTGVADHRNDVVVLKFGRAKGQTVAEADTENLEWYARVLRESLGDPSKARFHASNERELAAIEAELETR